MFLYYGSTNFEFDGVPAEIGRLSNLVEYDASYTLYFGPLRGETFANMPFLNYLVLGGNSYNSSIPAEIGQLPSLENFYAEDSFITGDLSFIEEGMPSIFEMWIDNNPGIVGTLPTLIGELSTLASISLTENSLTGTLPTEIADRCSKCGGTTGTNSRARFQLNSDFSEE